MFYARKHAFSLDAESPHLVAPLLLLRGPWGRRPLLLPRAAPVEAAPVGGGAAVHAAPSPSRGHGPERPQPISQPPSPSNLGPHTVLLAAAAVVGLGVVAVGGGGGGGGGGGLGGGAVRGALLVHLAVLLLHLCKTRTDFVQRLPADQRGGKK